MTIEKGAILGGKVVNITKFGAFIEVEGKTGLVHISEVSNTFIKDINEVLKVGQEVMVKVLTIDESGKMSLSIKATEESNKKNIEENTGFRKNRLENNEKMRDNTEHSPNFSNRTFKEPYKGPQSFEDMLNKFNKSSEEKMAEYKRRSEGFGNKKRRS